MDKITLRPSSLDTFMQCPQQWYQVFINGRTSIPNSRAAIGTAIHAGVEQMWNESIQVKTQIHSLSAMTDAAIESWSNETHDGVQYDSGENENTCAAEIVTGLETFVEDVVPWVTMPTAVEERYTVTIDDHPIVEAVSGTLDYINTDLGAIADLKTGKRKHVVTNSQTQQSLYKYLAQENGVDVQMSLIQNVVLKAKPEGHVMEASINVDQAKGIVNQLLDVLEVANQDIVNPDILFRGNPKYYLCSPKYCAFYNECKFVGNGG
jgi:hypothetical protein